MKVLKGFMLSIIAVFMMTFWCSAQELPKVLDTLVVTATKYETPLKEIPASVTVIRADDITRQHLPNGDVGNILRSVVGITSRRATNC